MSEPDDVGKEVWKRWILEAIRKIRSQKQRPSVERICHAIRQHHNYHEDVVSERLERAVREGAVLKVYNKGQSSYKDPGGLQSRTLRIAPDVDVSRAVAKAVRELGERDGSDLKTIEKHLQQAYQVTVDPEVDVRAVLRAAAKRAVTRGLITHHQGAYKAAERPRASSHERTPKQRIKSQDIVDKSRMYELVLKIWQLEEEPQEWNVGVICPIHKKGSKKNTIDLIFLLRQLKRWDAAKRWEYAQSIHSLFVYFTKAYNSIDREALYSILLNFNIPRKPVAIITTATKNSVMRVRVGGELSEEFLLMTGLKQGDALSPVLFNWALEHVVRNVLALDVGVELSGRHTVIGYADDLALLGESREEVAKAAMVLEQEKYTGSVWYCWEDSVQADLRRLEVDDWQEAAHERDRWHALVLEAKTLFGNQVKEACQCVPSVLVQRTGIAPESQKISSPVTSASPMRIQRV
ncbi:hypothetical protein MSG28_012981 [Choristoneura fumiferana]|uniref:Uncharacterized protein n=1 Tax=Choristoneura fumiferana TaxID=7141 RepID=A0ACC0KRK3_CHOFU|nr:hypothetical protein MSG28_012981 [Choristoneura fumiferana]